jgi:glycerate kinase
MPMENCWCSILSNTLIPLLLVNALNGERQDQDVQVPISSNVKTVWALLHEGQSKTALIEIAAAFGLDLITPAQRNPLIATSFGTGQSILQALDLGVIH